jgi:hypothetical protein
MHDQFSLDLLQAVSDWQRGGNKKQNLQRGLKLKQASLSLNEKYRSCNLCCFRQIALPKGGVWALIGNDCLPEKISSWTPDIEIAKGFKGGVPPNGQGYQGVIFCVDPRFASVIVNLRALYSEPAFVEAMERNRSAITSHSSGAGRYANSQSEVVLEVRTVTQGDVHSLGGHSSPFEDLLDTAAKEIYGRAPTAQEREALLLRSENIKAKAGPVWLNPEATQRVLTNIKPKARVLSNIKRQQDRTKNTAKC